MSNRLNQRTNALIAQVKDISNCVWADRKRALAARAQEKNNTDHSEKHGALSAVFFILKVGEADN